MREKKIVFVACLIAIAAASAFAQNPTPVQSNVATQQLTLMPQNPVPQVTQVTAAPSIQGPATYYYWIVSHDVSGNVSVPTGPFLVNNAPATIGGISVITVDWTPVSGVATYDVLRTSTTAVPTGACNCAVTTGEAFTHVVDTLASTNAYTVSTSASQIPISYTTANPPGTSLPATLTAPGVFTNNLYNTNFLVTVGSTGSFCNAPFSDSNYTDAVTACISTPSSGVTNAYNSAVDGRIFVNDSTSDSGNVNHNVPGSGLHGIAWCEVSNTVCEGSFTVGVDKAGTSNAFVVGAEADADIFSASNTGTGLWLIPAGTAQPTGPSSFPAIYIWNFSAVSKFTTGLDCQTGAIYNPGGFTPHCIDMFEKSAGANQTSTGLAFHASNSSSVDTPLTLLESVDANGTVPFLASDQYFYIEAWLQLFTKTFSTLPVTCNSAHEGFEAAVTDSTTVTFNATITGGGTNHVHAYCNGTSWVVQ